MGRQKMFLAPNVQFRSYVLRRIYHKRCHCKFDEEGDNQIIVD